MRDSIRLKDYYRENLLFSRRAYALIIAVVIFMILLMSRMIYLQIIQNDFYSTMSLNNRVRLVPIPPTRGLIYDRNGILLAENLPTFGIDLIVERTPDLEQTLEELADIIHIRPQDLEKFHRLRKRTKPFDPVPLRLRLSEEEVAKFASNRHLFPAAELTATLTRHYPFGALTAHVLGYVGRLDEYDLKKVDTKQYSGTRHIGKIGIERFYESHLHGSVGHQQIETNARGRIQRVLKRTPPEPGKNLHLALDINLQQKAMSLLKDQRGSLVAMEPFSGEVFTLVSMPTYDPNLFVNGIDQQSFDALNQSIDRPLFNRAIRGQYPPGSTIKPMLGLAALDNEIIARDYKVYDPGWYQLKNDDHKYRDWRRGGHGWVDYEKAIVESCDTYYYDISLRMGIDTIGRFLHEFGFGQPTQIDMGSEASGLLPSREWKYAFRNEPWFPGETLITGIGQGFFLATPLQLAYATSIVASQGHRTNPHLLRATSDHTSNNLDLVNHATKPPLSLKNPANWQLTTQAMVAVITHIRGTANSIADGLSYSLAGKTGTAQVFGIEQGERYEKDKVAVRLRDHALFVAFAPAEKPQIAVALIVENGGSGGQVAAPIIRDFLDFYFTEKSHADI
ncbi:MAG TPA: penicillin-binding protein 2 [Gammaproteobacteria bacterium]|nr:penicillin-binding protein 2 [Gammaproteobacteria bacterium]